MDKVYEHDLDGRARGDVYKGKYHIQMHGPQGHDVAAGLWQLQDGALRLLRDGDGNYLHATRVVRVVDSSRPDEVHVWLATGASDTVARDLGLKAGTRVLVRVDETGRPRVEEVLN